MSPWEDVVTTTEMSGEVTVLQSVVHGKFTIYRIVCVDEKTKSCRVLAMTAVKDT